jgi:hypothetical protein
VLTELGWARSYLGIAQFGVPCFQNRKRFNCVPFPRLNTNFRVNSPSLFPCSGRTFNNKSCGHENKSELQDGKAVQSPGELLNRVIHGALLPRPDLKSHGLVGSRRVLGVNAIISGRLILFHGGELYSLSTSTLLERYNEKG